MTTKPRWPLSGLALIHKPSGMTSFDCIRSLKRHWNRKDIGHGGTLDSFATGLLPVFVGEGLKLARFFLESYPTLPTYWKTYKAKLLIGHETDTGDPTGNITFIDETPLNLSTHDIERSFSFFVNKEYLQTPPSYSAKKIQGKRASDLMRSGVEVELKPVAVAIKELKLLQRDGNSVELEVTCSKGTYIRVLAQDLARAWGTRAHLVALERTAVGGFGLSQAHSLESALTLRQEIILDMKSATSFMPTIYIDDRQSTDLKHGKLQESLVLLQEKPPGVWCFKNSAQEPMALIEWTPEREGRFLRGFV